jgi:hypothetical protein
MRREQLFVHLCICAFVWPMSTIKPPKKTNTQKTPSDGNCSTMLICVFVYLCIHQQNHSLRAYLQALRDRRWHGQQISPPLRVSRSRTDHSRLALRTEKSLSYPKIADEVIESNLLGEEEKCPANLRVNEKR